MVEKRHRIAVNAGFANFRDYKFAEMGRFDYKPEDCFQFHQEVKEKILPLVNEIYERKKKRLGVDTLRPWDLEAHPADEKALNPFKTGDELVESLNFNELAIFAIA